MGVFNFFRNKKIDEKPQTAHFEMVTDKGNGFYGWDGKLYKSDLVRSCIRPRTKAVGMAIAKHVRITVDNETGEKDININPDIYMKFLLEEPNPLMSGQVMQEKIANQYSLNNNAFILIVRDSNGIPCELYPIPCTGVDAIYNQGELYLKFYYQNGKYNTFPYTEIIHLRDDFVSNDIFGEKPGKALADLMECVKITDQGLVKAIKNSGIIRWLLKFNANLRKEDIKSNVQNFVETYLDASTDTFGAAGVDTKTDVERVEPKDYVPNALVMESLRKRTYMFFNVNEKIVSGDYTEDEWNAYFNIAVSPLLTQMHNEFTRKLFSRKDRYNGNSIEFEASNLYYASMKTKLQLTTLVDRAMMTPNEARQYFYLPPIPGGDTALLRKDTGTANEAGVDNNDNTDDTDTNGNNGDTVNNDSTNKKVDLSKKQA